MKQYSLAAGAAVLALAVPALAGAASSDPVSGGTPAPSSGPVLTGTPTGTLVLPDGTTQDFGTDIKGCITADVPAAGATREEMMAGAVCRIDYPSQASAASAKKPKQHAVKRHSKRAAHK